MESFTADCTKTFISKRDYLNQLYKYCKEHNYTYEDPERLTSGGKTIKKQTEDLWKEVLQTKGEVSVETIGIDPNDTKRFMLIWAEEYSNVMVNTYCSPLTGDYNKEVANFCRDFFKSDYVSDPEPVEF